MKRRALVPGLLVVLATCGPNEVADLLISGGTLYDGSGGPAQVGDMMIRADEIVFVGDGTSAGVVNGELAVENRALTGHSHGRTIRRTVTP